MVQMVLAFRKSFKKKMHLFLTNRMQTEIRTLGIKAQAITTKRLHPKP